MNRHQNLLGLLCAMRVVVAKRPNTGFAIDGKGFWDDVPGPREPVETAPPLERHVRFRRSEGTGSCRAPVWREALLFPSVVRWSGSCAG